MCSEAVLHVRASKFKPSCHRTAQKPRFSTANFFSECDQICSFLLIWSHLLKKSVMENLSTIPSKFKFYLGAYS